MVGIVERYVSAERSRGDAGQRADARGSGIGGVSLRSFSQSDFSARQRCGCAEVSGFVGGAGRAGDSGGGEMRVKKSETLFWNCCCARETSSPQLVCYTSRKG